MHPFINLWVVCLLKSWYPILVVLFTKYCNPGYIHNVLPSISVFFCTTCIALTNRFLESCTSEMLLWLSWLGLSG
jgi:hypothetical protein